MPTGGGKSLCYQLPAMAMEGLTLVVSRGLIALMKDQVDALRGNGVPAAFINSTLDFEGIGRVQRAALDGKLKVLYAAPERVTTPEFLRFLDSVRRTGRAGRDGKPSDCVLFFSEGDRAKQQYFIQQMEDGPVRDMAERQLEQIVEYGRLRSCRRKYLLAYFGEAMAGESCERCDSCFAVYRRVDVTEPAQKILSAVIRTGERFGIFYVNRVLLGSRDKRIGRLGHDRLSVYGIVDDYDRNGLRTIAEMLVERGLLAKEEGSQGAVRVTPEGRSWLSSGQRLEMDVREDESAPRPARRSEQGADERGTGGHDEGLFQELRTLRRRLAEEQGVPAFVVFNDAALRGLASAKPATPEAMLKVSGVGPAKVQRYGEAFLAAIREHSLGLSPCGRD